MRPCTDPVRPRPGPKGILLLLALAPLLGSCRGNGYRQFYEPYLDVRDGAQARTLRALEQGEEPRIVATGDLEAEVRRLRAAGYVVIGHAGFTGPAASEAQIASQARAVGATVAVHSRAYQETVSGSISMPSTTTSTTSVGGLQATTTTYGTTSRPYSVQRYLHEAYFLAEATERPRIGVFLRDLTEADRRGAGRNTGAAVDLVLDDSPAFRGDLVPGDVLVAVDGTRVASASEAIDALKAIPSDRTGCELTIVRNGEERVVALSGLLL